MNIFKIFLCCGAVCAAAITAQADNPVITVTTTDNRTIEFETPVETRGEYSFPKDSKVYNLVVFSGRVILDENNDYVPDAEDPGTIYLKMPVTGISDIRFDYTSGIGEVENPGIKVDVINGKIRFTGVEHPAKVTICSVAGTVEDIITVTSDTEIDLNRYGAGIHVVTIDNTTFKILTK